MDQIVPAKRSRRLFCHNLQHSLKRLRNPLWAILFRRNCHHHHHRHHHHHQQQQQQHLHLWFRSTSRALEYCRHLVRGGAGKEHDNGDELAPIDAAIGRLAFLCREILTFTAPRNRTARQRFQDAVSPIEFRVRVDPPRTAISISRFSVWSLWK